MGRSSLGAFGGAGSPTVVPVRRGYARMASKVGCSPERGRRKETGSDLTVRVVNLSGSDLVVAGYEDAEQDGRAAAPTLSSKGKMIADGELSHHRAGLRRAGQYALHGREDFPAGRRSGPRAFSRSATG